MKKLLPFLCLFPIFIGAQVYRPTLNLDVSYIELTDCATGTTCTRQVSVYNEGTTTATVSVSGVTSPFEITPTNFSIAGQSTQVLTVKFTPVYNITYYSPMVIDAVSGLNAIVTTIFGRGKYTDANNYYLGTEDLWGSNLRDALRTKITTGHTALGYNTGRDKMFSTLIDGFNGTSSNRQLECIYTGRVITLANSSSRPNASSPDYMNTEHTWPQSFFNSNDPMVSDIHHLFPTDADANNERASFPFGNVASRTSARCNDMDFPSQNGTCTNQGSGDWSYLQNSVYEPRDVQKGNTARAMFYFITRYPTNYGGFYTVAQENVFKQWHSQDPPTAKDVTRNSGVQTAQGNRNPYVDHPDFIDRIGTFGGGTLGSPPITSINTYFPTAENFGNVQVNTSLDATVTLLNTGTQDITVNTVSISGNGFSISSAGTGNVLVRGQWRKVGVRFSPTTLGQSYTGTLTVNTSAGTFTTTLNGIGATATPTDVENPHAFHLNKVYPNPFSDQTALHFLLYQPDYVQLKVYDVLGREVLAQSLQLEAGEHELPISAATLSNGIYMAHLSIGNQLQTFKLAVQK